MTAYYNEFDLYAAEWLRNLIKAGLIPAGDVDTRSIVEVQPDDLKRYTQCHFFAGIGGWSHALKLAMWPDDRPVWTGSCPCQPFSSAGKQKGQKDERHLWPVWFRLIRECRPPVIFGEQVASAIAHGWLDEVAHDMEGEGYAVAASVLPACSVGAPHKRDRLWFVADCDRHRCDQRRESFTETGSNGLIRNSLDVANAAGAKFSGRMGRPRPEGRTGFADISSAEPLENAESIGWREGRAEPAGQQGRSCSASAGASIAMDDAIGARLEGLPRNEESCGGGGRLRMDQLPRQIPSGLQDQTEKPGQLNPEFVCWLMGFPPEWDACAPMAMPSSRKSRRNSSQPTERP